jgi:hypothetical protein
MNNLEDKKPREFWVTCESPFVGTAHYEKQAQGIHVIEHSAYEITKKENTSLRESLKLAVGALELYSAFESWRPLSGKTFDTAISMDSDGEGYVPGNKAREALAKIKAEHGEL